MRKVLGSISLLVLLLNTLLTPLTYAGEYEEILEISGENTAEEVNVEENGDEEMAPEFSVEEKNGEEKSGGEDIENSTGDTVEEGSGEVFEVGSGEIEDLTGDIVLGDTGTIVEELTGFSVELTGEMTGSSVTGEETEVEEIKYNEKPILGEKTYNDVTVKVEALTGIFPEGTELIITPIKWWNLSNLKDKLVEEHEEVKEDTTVVAFDITFMYSGEEVQPKEGEKVKVTFDYKNNEDLLEADKNDNQEIKVYHIEDKDEEGNKLVKGEEKIEEIEINGIESKELDNGLVIDVEKFSIYVLALSNDDTIRLTLDPRMGGSILDVDNITVDDAGIGTIDAIDGYVILPGATKENSNFIGWYDGNNERKGGSGDSYPVLSSTTLYAKWEDILDTSSGYFPEVFSQKGACIFNGKNGTITGAECTKYYGNQFINTEIQLYEIGNHSKDYEIGFKIDHYLPSEQDAGIVQQTFMNTKREASGYPGLVFRRSDNVVTIASRRTSDKNSEWKSSNLNVETVKIYRIFNNDTNKKEIYYSINGSDKKLLNDLSQYDPIFDLDVWFGATPTDGTATVAQRFLNATLSNMYIKLGTYMSKVTWNYRDEDGNLINEITDVGFNGTGILNHEIPDYETSEESCNFEGWKKGGQVVDISTFKIQNDVTFEASYSCDVSKEYKITYDLDGGFMKLTTDGVEENPSIYTKVSPTFTVNNPVKLNAIFIGWTGTDLSEKTMSLIIPYGSTGDREYIALYECEQGYSLNENGECVGIRNADGTLNFNVWNYGTVDFEVGESKITLLDRNLGASTDDISNTGSYGFYYKGGNNFGFSPNHTSKYGSTRVKVADVSGYGPGTASGYYLSHDWIYSNSEDNWFYGQNPNLWGDVTNTQVARQGPCPNLYHVPFNEEINGVRGMINEYSNTQSGVQCIATYGNKRLCFQNIMRIPTAGFLLNTSSDSSQRDSMTRAFLWMSSRSKSNSSKFSVFHSTNVDPMDGNANMMIGDRFSIFAMPVRCFKNTDVVTVSYELNGGTAKKLNNPDNLLSKTGFWYELDLGKGVKNPMDYTMTRNNSSFSGWYLDDEYTKPFTGGTVFPYITQDTTFYAKFNCDEGYIETDDGMACVKEGYVVTFDAVSNGGTTLTGSIEVASGVRVELNKYTATPNDSSYQFIGWSENPNSSVILQTDPVITSNKTLYAVFSKEISATFNANGNKLDNANDNITKSCTVYNKENQCTITTPIVSNAITTTVVGYTTSQEGASSSNTGSNLQINISGGEVYYAQTMTSEKVLTGSVNGNNSTLSSYDPISCTLTGVYNGETQATSCEVDMPTITPHTNTKTVVGWNTTADSTTNNSSFNINTNKLRLTVENTKQIWYAITKALEVHLSITYQKGTGVESIGENLSGCTIEATYNGNPQVTTCTLKAPTITVKLGYNEENKRWKKVGGDDEKLEGDTITLDKSETYEASTNIITYTIEYILNDGNVEVINPASYTVESGDITLNNPTREGYIFEGWSGTNLTEPTETVTIVKGSVGGRVYEANWRQVTHTVTYDAASHSGTIGGNEIKEVVVNDNDAIQLTGDGSEIAVSHKEGYQFIGWTNELGGTEPITEEQTITSDVTFYPVFKKDSEQRTSLFSGNGAALSGNSEVEISCTIPAVYNTGVQETVCSIITPNIQRDGYEILGYSTDKNHKATCSITGNQEIQIAGDEVYYAITKKNLTAIFNKNGNIAQTKYGASETTEDDIEESCSIWNQETECEVWTPSILPSTDKTSIGYTTSTTSSGENLTGENVRITLSESLMRYYAWTQSTPQEVKVNYVYSTGVVQGTTTENNCWTEVRYNGDENQTGCMISLPVLQIKTGYVAPKWYRTETEVVETDSENKAMFYYANSPIILTGKAEISGKISYVVKHYFQMLEDDTITNKYALNQSYTDTGLSGAADTILILSGLKKEIEGFEYFKATVNGQSVNDIIDISQAIEYAETHQLTTPVEIKLLYTRNKYEYLLNQHANVSTEGSTLSNAMYYGQTVILSGNVTNDCYERSGWQGLPENVENIQQTSFTMPAGNVTITPIVKDKTYTIVFDKNALNAEGTVPNLENVKCSGQVQLDSNKIYTRNGYEFKEWNTNSDGTGTGYVKDAIITTALTKTGGAVVTLYAHWTANKYIVTFDANGGVVSEPDRQVTFDEEYGVLPIPTREGYTFSGWYTQAEGGEYVTGTTTVTRAENHTLYAQWKVKMYTITWKNSIGSVLETDENVPYGTMPSYDGEEPTSGGNVQYTYTFSGWTPATGMVVGDQVYTATYISTVNKYEITFVDEDGTELKSVKYDYGTLSGDIEKPADPTKAADAQYTYSFIGWDPEVHNVTGAQVYTAIYDRTINKYSVLWKNRDGDVLETDENVEYGSKPKYDGNTPLSGETLEYQYRFAGWNPSITNETIIEGDTVYTATYESIKRKYQITWNDYDDQVIDITEVEYGVIPTHTNPLRTGYQFNFWDPIPVEVVGPTSYKATYTIKQYTVTPEKGVGVADILGGGTYDYGTEIVLTGVAKEGYHFEGGVKIKEFNVDVPAQNITVKINAQPNIYYVHFKNNGGEGVMNDQAFTYDQEQALNPNAYIRNGFTFVSWTDGEGGIYKDKAVVKNLITSGTINLIAQWIEGDVPGPTPPIPEPSGGGSSGGGRIIDKNIDDKEHDSAEDKQQEKDVKDDQIKKDLIIQTGGDIKQITGDTSVIVPESVYHWTEEELTAYKFAYKYGITTLAPEYAAMPDDYVQRGHMAKMVVNYALNVLHRKLPEKLPRECRWLDGRNAWESQEIKDYAEKSCALGIMGIDMKYFQPKKYVTRAQFGTIIGRLMWGKLPSKPYYAGHLARLKERGIMTQIENPENRIEIRKWAWLMFMRMEKYIM